MSPKEIAFEGLGGNSKLVDLLAVRWKHLTAQTTPSFLISLLFLKLSNQNHFYCLQKISYLQPEKIDPARQIRAINPDRIFSSRLTFSHQRSDLLPMNIINPQLNISDI